MKRSDERFERLFNELRESREESNRRFEEMESRFDNLEDWVGIVLGGFQRRAGRKLEDAIAGTLRLALKRDIKPENITMRKKIKDDEGMIGPKGREYEINLYITNGESLIFEIKSYAEEEDVERFNDKAELAKKKLNLKEESEEGDYHIGEASILRKVLQTDGYRGWIEWQEPAERYVTIEKILRRKREFTLYYFLYYFIERYKQCAAKQALVIVKSQPKRRKTLSIMLLWNWMSGAR